MAKINRIGGYTDARARGFVSPADELRARGKLGPYGEVEPAPGADADADLQPADDGDVTGALTGEPGTVPAAAVDEPLADDIAPVDLEALASANPSMGHPVSAEALQDVPEEESWPGSSSETSPEKPPKNDEPRKPSPRKRARSAGAPSGSTKGSGTAPTGTTSGPVTGA